VPVIISRFVCRSIVKIKNEYMLGRCVVTKWVVVSPDDYVASPESVPTSAEYAAGEVHLDSRLRGVSIYYGEKPFCECVSAPAARGRSARFQASGSHAALGFRTYSGRSARTRSAVSKAPGVRIVYGCNEATYADRSTMSSSVSFITTGFIVIAFFPLRVPLLKS
jgi:hypothetical protein